MIGYFSGPCSLCGPLNSKPCLNYNLPLLSNPEIKNIFHKLVSPVRAASYGIWFVATRIYGALLSEINPVVSYINLGVHVQISKCQFLEVTYVAI